MPIKIQNELPAKAVLESENRLQTRFMRIGLISMFIRIPPMSLKKWRKGFKYLKGF